MVSLIADAVPVLHLEDIPGRIHRDRVDALVFDARLVGAEGITLIRDIKSTQKPTRFLPILAAAESYDVLLREQLIDAGVTDLIDLPLKVVESRCRLEHLLRAQSWHAQLAESGATLDREREETYTARRELLPTNFPRVAGWDFAARVRNQGRFTGDSYEIFQVSPSRIVISVADALGSDVISLIRLAMVRAWVRVMAARAADVSEVFEELNRLTLETYGDDGRFVTLYIGFLDPTTAGLDHASAGFIEPVLWGGESAGSLSLNLSGGPPLGVSSDAIYRQSTLALEPGSRLILGTHGLQRGRRGPGELLERVAATRSLSPAETADALTRREPQPSARDSSGMRDVTFLIIERLKTRGSKPGQS
jgi:serine phosphatase RsbU (regulator of sigma subunit)